MRVGVAVILGMMLLTPRALAQDGNVTAVVSTLQTVLSHLKDTVQKMSMDNDQLAARDNDIKAQVLQLQAQLSQLQNQGALLTNKLHDKSSRRDRQIARLEEENSALDARRQKAQESIRSIQKSLNTGYQEDQRLLLQLNGDPHALAMQSPLEVHRQKEKLQLIKMIYDSQQRQEAWHGAIMKFQKSILLVPPAAKVGTAQPPVEGQVSQLEEELRSLEGNYAQLKNLTQQMGQKAISAKLALGQHIEERKLQGSLDDMIRQGEELRLELGQLRAQMVDLDKRKTSLEAMIQHLR